MGSTHRLAPSVFNSKFLVKIIFLKNKMYKKIKPTVFEPPKEWMVPIFLIICYQMKKRYYYNESQMFLLFLT